MTPYLTALLRYRTNISSLRSPRFIRGTDSPHIRSWFGVPDESVEVVTERIAAGNFETSNVGALDFEYYVDALPVGELDVDQMVGVRELRFGVFVVIKFAGIIHEAPIVVRGFARLAKVFGSLFALLFKVLQIRV